MMATHQELKLADLKGLRDGLLNERNAIIRFRDDHQRYERDRKYLVDKITKLQSQLSELDDRWENGDSRVDDLNARIAELNRDIARARYGKKLEQLRKLQAGIEKINDAGEEE